VPCVAGVVRQLCSDNKAGRLNNTGNQVFKGNLKFFKSSYRGEGNAQD